jgi:hypothetical protein
MTREGLSRAARDHRLLAVALAALCLGGVAAGCAVGAGGASAGATTLTTTTTDAAPSPGVQVGMPTTSGASTTTSGDTASSRYVGPITNPVTYPGAGISLEAPTNPSQASVSWEAALRNCSSRGMCVSGSPVTVSLASATDPEAGQARPDGSIAPIMENTLVFVMTQSGIPCSPVGSPARATTTPATYACTFLSFVDARTDQLLYSVSGPGL